MLNIKHLKIAKISKGSSFVSEPSNAGLHGGSTDLIHSHTNIRERPHCANETVALVSQRGGRCLVPRNIPGQVGWGSEQRSLVEDVPAHGRGVGLDDL